jgi:hypothetical protein
MNRKQKAALSALALPLAAGSLVAAPTYAGPPHTIDPGLMVPELNPDFAPWTCMRTGDGATCTGELEDSYANLPIGLECDGHEVYVTGTFAARTVRWHDAQMRATKTSLQTTFLDRLTLSPTAEPDADYVVFSGHWHKHYDYPVPGDLAARVLTESGAIYRIHEPGAGQLLRDTGQVTFAPGADYEDVDQAHGVHEVYDGTGDVDDAICAGLT